MYIYEVFCYIRLVSIEESFQHHSRRCSSSICHLCFFFVFCSSLFALSLPCIQTHFSFFIHLTMWIKASNAHTHIPIFGPFSSRFPFIWFPHVYRTRCMYVCILYIEYCCTTTRVYTAENAFSRPFAAAHIHIGGAFFLSNFRHVLTIV